MIKMLIREFFCNVRIVYGIIELKLMMDMQSLLSRDLTPSALANNCDGITGFAQNLHKIGADHAAAINRYFHIVFHFLF